MMSSAIHAAQHRQAARGRALPARGFTVIELMLSLVVLAIIVALGAPALNNFVIQSRMTSQINELLADVSYARNEAATRGVRIGFCASANATSAAATCSSAVSDWANGRIVFVDVDGDGSRNTGSGSTEILLKSSAALTGSSTMTVTWSGSGAAPASFQFRPYGGMATANSAVIGTSTITTNVTYKICPSTSGKEGRQLSIGMTGRPTITRVGC
jgi:type IV fimbrial biogenesis protein FimT